MKKNRSAAIAQLMLGAPTWFRDPLLALRAAARPRGSLGVLIGADLLNLEKLQDLGVPVLSIGGADTFDGIFVTGKRRFCGRGSPAAVSGETKGSRRLAHDDGRTEPAARALRITSRRQTPRGLPARAATRQLTEAAAFDALSNLEALLQFLWVKFSCRCHKYRVNRMS